MSAHIIPRILDRGLHYATVPHALLEFDGLSLAARAVAAWMLDRPPGWTFHVNDICGRFGISARKWRGIRDELTDAGCLSIARSNSARGFEWQIAFDPERLLDMLAAGPSPSPSRPISINTAPIPAQINPAPATRAVPINPESHTIPHRPLPSDNTNKESKKNNTPAKPVVPGGDFHFVEYGEAGQALAARLKPSQMSFASKLIGQVTDARTGQLLDSDGRAELIAMLADPSTLDPVALLRSLVKTGFRRGSLANWAHPGENWSDVKARLTGKPARARCDRDRGKAAQEAAHESPQAAPEAPQDAARAGQPISDPETAPEPDFKQTIRDNPGEYEKWLEAPSNATRALVTRMLIKSAGSLDAALDVHSPVSLLAAEFADYLRRRQEGPACPKDPRDDGEPRISFAKLVALARQKERERAGQAGQCGSEADPPLAPLAASAPVAIDANSRAEGRRQPTHSRMRPVSIWTKPSPG